MLNCELIFSRQQNNNLSKRTNEKIILSNYDHFGVIPITYFKLKSYNSYSLRLCSRVFVRAVSSQHAQYLARYDELTRVPDPSTFVNVFWYDFNGCKFESKSNQLTQLELIC